MRESIEWQITNVSVLCYAFLCKATSHTMFFWDSNAQMGAVNVIESSLSKNMSLEGTMLPIKKKQTT